MNFNVGPNGWATLKRSFIPPAAHLAHSFQWIIVARRRLTKLKATTTKNELKISSAINCDHFENVNKSSRLINVPKRVSRMWESHQCAQWKCHLRAENHQWVCGRNENGEKETAVIWWDEEHRMQIQLWSAIGCLFLRWKSNREQHTRSARRRYESRFFDSTRTICISNGVSARPPGRLIIQRLIHLQDISADSVSFRFYFKMRPYATTCLDLPHRLQTPFLISIFLSTAAYDWLSQWLTTNETHHLLLRFRLFN